jgi:hypothetical protein
MFRMLRAVSSKRYNTKNRARYRRLELLRKRAKATPIPKCVSIEPSPGTVIRLSGDMDSGFVDPAEGTKTIAMAITTAGREGSTIVNALSNIRKVGFRGPVHVFAEPNSVRNTVMRAEDPKTVIHRHNVVRGCFGNWKYAAQWMFENTDEDWVLIMQDDVVWCRKAAGILQHAVEHANLTHCGYLSPYTSPAMVPDRAASFHGTWIHARRRNFWGAVATCYPRNCLEYLLKCPIFLNHRGSREVDRVIGDVFFNCEDGRWPIIHIPSLATHVGKVSTIGRHKNPRSQWARCGFRFDSDFKP